MSLINPITLTLSHISSKKLKEPYSSGIQVDAGFKETNVLCMVTLDRFGPA